VWLKEVEERKEGCGTKSVGVGMQDEDAAVDVDVDVVFCFVDGYLLAWMDVLGRVTLSYCERKGHYLGITWGTIAGSG